jgi:hypothetical protein
LLRASEQKQKLPSLPAQLGTTADESMTDNDSIDLNYQSIEYTINNFLSYNNIEFYSNSYSVSTDSSKPVINTCLLLDVANTITCIATNITTWVSELC